MRPTRNRHRNAPKQQFRIGLAGPCGVGKSTLASLLASQCEGMAVICEPKAPGDIEVAGAPSPNSAEHFQRLMSAWRLEQVMLNAGARILLFDRLLEEDREVFLQLYSRLGYINKTQLERLVKLSRDTEAAIGSPDGIIVLTAAPQILRQRLHQARHQRPPWLVKHIELQHALYGEWIAKKRDKALVLDTSRTDSHSMCAVALQYIAGILAGNRTEEHKRSTKAQ